ncbi:MAG: autotransporter outer membrane beta-barrel domain-containing protein [Endomicrobia bacterium]|nr:autotransporter outer membrane beta-barrel domain-containing protein [Endomicrobiia bacterium]
MKKSLSLLVAVLFCVSSAFAGETIVFDGSDTTMLQTVNAISNSLAPLGSSSGKSSSISDNSITLSSGSVGGVFGAININDTQAVANNSVFVTGGSTGSSVYGGYSSSGTITGNTVNISGGSMTGGAYGGFTNLSGGNITDNTVNITGGSVAGDVVGGSSRWGSGNATGNTVNISGGSTGNQVFGGWSQNGNVTGNTVNISGGSIGWHVTGGYISSAGSATYNTVTISGSPTITGNVNGGNGSGTGDVFTGNTLNVWNYSGSSVWSVQNFEFYNFILPAGAANGYGPYFTATDVNFTGPAVNSKVTGVNFMGGGAAPQAGDSFILLTSNLTGTIANNGETVSGWKGAALIYDSIQVNQTGTGAGQSLTATILSAPYAKPQAKILSEGAAAGAILAAQGAGLTAGDLLSNLQEDKTEAVAAFFGGNLKYDTGSSVEMNAIGIAAGIAKKFNSASAGVFIEYASGSFDTEYNGLKGDGSASAVGIGIMTKKDVNESMYIESLIRAGQLSNDYKNKLQNFFGTTADYDYDSTYIGLGLGIGQIFKLSEKISLDYSWKYALTSVGKSETDLSTGEKYKMDSFVSSRVKAGAKSEYKINETIKPYLELAYDYELSGDINAKVDGCEIEAPSLKGGTFIGGLGASAKVMERLTLDLGVNVLSGVRSGVTGGLQAKLQF